MAKNIDAELVRRAATNRWGQILAKLAPKLADALKEPGRTRIECPKHASQHGRDGFRFYKDALQTGGGVCNTCRNSWGGLGFKDGLEILRWYNGWELWEACEEVAAVLGLEGGNQARNVAVPAPTPDPMAEEKRQRDDEECRVMLQRVLSESLPLDDPRAEAARLYFARRALPVGVIDLATYRFHPALVHFDEKSKQYTRWPAIIAIFSDAAGVACTLHRTYITKDGMPAPVYENKKLMRYRSSRDVRGGAIRIGPATSVLGIAEGWENARSVTAGTGMTCWAATTAVLLEQFVPPDGVEALVIWADLDRSNTGQLSARKLRLRLMAQVHVQIRYPAEHIPAGGKGVDFNDIWKEFGTAGFSVPEILQKHVA